MKTKIFILFALIISSICFGQQPEFLEQPIFLNNPLVPCATLLIDLRPNQSEITRPLIIAEGFDAGSVITPEEEFGDTDLISFHNKI
ncbi:MAG: hypothetical protein ACK5M1_07430 [Xanthomarina gelatinilytica]|uniref:hypothetical protein n=1 Tax=Xanthomarina gelatinilytica TaxID=1137281 RepID=UPI003A8387B4